MKKYSLIYSAFFTIVFFSASHSSQAVVKRHDVAESKYEVMKAPDFLIDMPHEGQAVLIAPQWIVTVAHTIFYDYKGKALNIGDKDYVISEVVIHPGYKPFPEDFDFSKRPNIKKFIVERDDIALIKLSTPVQDLIPIALYKKRDEINKTVTIFGKGATGDGIKGLLVETMKERKLRRCQNVINQSEGHWLSYQFDSPEFAIALEGIHGRGDSGGPSVIYKNQTPTLVGLSSWQWEGDNAEYEPSLYGTIGYQTRISSYIDWIVKITAN